MQDSGNGWKYNHGHGLGRQTKDVMSSWFDRNPRELVLT